MGDDILVQVDHVSKKFCRDLKRSLWYGVKDIGGELLGRSNDSVELRKDEFWAVKDVSFQLRRGECLGLIGRNGAGKSTLLKMLNGLIKPDRGQIAMCGRVGALIELGAGFNPILTGRENIYVNGAVLGFSKAEIDRKFEAIVDFAALEEFIDMPVQSYSSGMKVRLGFAVAAQMEPDVLIVDEVLAVGDVGFRAKCIDAIARLNKDAAVIVVSHNMPQVARVSSSAMIMESGGTLLLTQDVQEAIGLYLRQFQGSQRSRVGGGVTIHQLLFRTEEPLGDNDRISLRHGADATLEIVFSLAPEVERCRLNIVITDMEIRAVAQLSSQSADLEIINTGTRTRLLVEVPSLPLGLGTYNMDVYFVEILPDGRNGPLFYHEHVAATFDVVGTHHTSAAVQLVAKWNLSEAI